MPTSRGVWIPCTIEKGMFSNELAVEVTIKDKTVSFFADKSLIMEIKDEPHVLVTLIGDNGEPNHKTILLPSESFETGSRWLSIPDRVLKAA